MNLSEAKNAAKHVNDEPILNFDAADAFVVDVVVDVAAAAVLQFAVEQHE